MNRQYGWRPDLPDARDSYRAKVGWFKAVLLPSQTDLRPKMPAVYDQGQLGSCAANAIGAAIEFQRAAEKLPDFVPSRLFIYYNARVLEGDPSDDNGMQIRNGIKSVVSTGACPELDWPYNPSQFAVQPSPNCYAEAKTDLVIAYQRVSQTLDDMKAILAGGEPFVFGISVYDSFESEAVATSGIVPMPAQSESMIGGHAMLAVGYDDARQAFIVRNSWGADWGQAGYCFLPYAYLTSSDLASDLWAVQAVGGGS